MAMSKNLDQALAAVRDWHAKVGDNLDAFNFKRGDRVRDMAGDGSLLYIATFERNGNEEYHARCFVLGTDKIERVPVSRLKLSNVNTIH
jgi:hypothetical protein